MKISRRTVLIGLAASVPLASSLSSFAVFASDDSDLLKVSRIIVGRDDLDPKIAQRVFDALSKMIAGFDAKLATLAAALDRGQDRDTALAALDDANLDLALAIAQPWYIGIAGEISEHAKDGNDRDGAIFVTYLGAQAMRSVEHVLPFPSYSTGAPGWWAEPPDGVIAPPMPNEIRDWNYVPPGAVGPVAKEDPRFMALVMQNARKDVS